MYTEKENIVRFFVAIFVNQAQIASVRKRLYACVCVCPPLRLLITSGVMWCDIDPI